MDAAGVVGCYRCLASSTSAISPVHRLQRQDGRQLVHMALNSSIGPAETRRPSGVLWNRPESPPRPTESDAGQLLQLLQAASATTDALDTPAVTQVANPTDSDESDAGHALVQLPGMGST